MLISLDWSTPNLLLIHFLLQLAAVVSGVMKTPKQFKWIKSSVMHYRVTLWCVFWWFLSIAFHIPLAHDFHVISAPKWVCQLHIHVRDLPQAKLESEINAHFLVNKRLKVPFSNCIKLVFNSFPFHWMSKEKFGHKVQKREAWWPHG